MMLRAARHIPIIRALVAEAEAAREAFRFVPAGHYYSPIPSREQILADAERLATARPREIPGIALREEQQLALLDQLKVFYREQPFPKTKIPGRRYFFENPAYSYSDAICLYGMIRHVQPRRIIEVGSGYSSCVTLDTNELFFANRIACTFIEPFPALLRSLIKPDDLARVEIIASPLQEVDVARFRELDENDILFIDSTHVAKLGSDVNYIFAEILPALRRGVYVHFHDIFYPFEYPAAWLKEGRVWTEAYVLRAFLAFNSAYEIVLYNTFLERLHRSQFEQDMPLCLENEGGSIWLRRIT
jgi:predicted O-methyltransferase YrrM